MTLLSTLRSKSAAGLAAALLVSGVALAEAAPEYQPEVGQEGKDVIWVPTPQELVERMLDMAKITANDFVVDLGSGDGRTVITAAKRGVRAHGIEYNSQMVELAKREAQKAGVARRATFVRADLFESDFSKATVITMFLLKDINLKLRPRILDLKPGTRIVSNTFDMAEWAPDRTVRIDHCTQWCTAHLWIVPAKVDGGWTLADGSLEFKQQFQTVTGSVKRGAVTLPLRGTLSGDRIRFDAGGTVYAGRVKGTTIEGTMRPGGSWKATRG